MEGGWKLALEESESAESQCPDSLSVDDTDWETAPAVVEGLAAASGSGSADFDTTQRVSFKPKVEVRLIPTCKEKSLPVRFDRAAASPEQKTGPRQEIFKRGGFIIDSKEGHGQQKKVTYFFVPPGTDFSDDDFTQMDTIFVSGSNEAEIIRHLFATAFV